MYRGVIREKPTSEKEARDFIKGFHNGCQFPAFVAGEREMHNWKG